MDKSAANKVIPFPQPYLGSFQRLRSEITQRSIKEDDFHVRLRDGDIAECEAAGLTTAEAAMLSVTNSMMATAIDVNEQLAAMWGYGLKSFIDTSCCYAWLLTTPVCDENRISFMRLSQHIVRGLMDTFAEIEATVDVRYMPARNWLCWLGFKEIGPGPIPGFVVVRKGR